MKKKKEQAYEGLSKKEQTYEPIRLLEIELEEKKVRWLKKYGWKFETRKVDHHWFWTKKIYGEVLRVSLDEAIRIEINHA